MRRLSCTSAEKIKTKASDRPREYAGNYAWYQTRGRHCLEVKCQGGNQVSQVDIKHTSGKANIPVPRMVLLRFPTPEAMLAVPSDLS